MKSQIYISKKGFIILLFGTIILFVSSKKPADILQDNKWVAPAWADKMKNPFANNENATAEGKKTYNKLCWVCHGKSGKGDGPGSVNLDPKPADHTSQKVQQQSDGAIFWKITNGNPQTPMASYEKVLTVEQRWQVVNYIRTLSSKN